jgi:hypothetical protein
LVLLYEAMLVGVSSHPRVLDRLSGPQTFCCERHKTTHLETRLLTQPVLENYLARSLNMLRLASEDAAVLEEDLRMVKNVGAEHLGFVTFVWFEAKRK